MMNSESDFDAEDLICKVLDLLSEARIQREIDVPMDMARRNFCLKATGPFSHSSFNHLIAEFVQHVYRKGLRLPRHFSDQEALAEAIFLLNKYYQYQNEYITGYEAALIDFKGSGREGLEVVLSQLTESIRTVERGKYIQWVFTANINHMDWSLRCLIVESYIKKNNEILPKHLLDIDPARLADNLYDLFITHLA
ncbi:hypothetical protein ACFL0Q_01020, partial [Thermodesulfobacteriota bacterium]